MSTPKIGKAYEKASNALAYQARKLREEAVEAQQADSFEDIDTAVDRLASLATQHHESEQTQRETRAAATRAQYVPLIEKAERVLADNTAVVAEVAPLVRRLADLDWKAIRTRARNSLAVGSLHSTHTNLALLQRTVEEAVVLLRGDERDLVRYLTEIKSITGYEHEPTNLPYDEDLEYIEQKRQYAENGLIAVMKAIGSRADVLRAKGTTIRKILGEVAKDLAPVDVAMVEEAK
jgi:hypothetical protein